MKKDTPYKIFKIGHIPVNYIELMKMFKRKQQLSAVEPKIQSTTGQANIEYYMYRARFSSKRCSRCKWWNNSPPFTNLQIK